MGEDGMREGGKALGRPRVCPSCNGKKTFPKMSGVGERDCITCDGKGEVQYHICRKCNGEGIEEY